jgi:hypothetical protein
VLTSSPNTHSVLLNLFCGMIPIAGELFRTFLSFIKCCTSSICTRIATLATTDFHLSVSPAARINSIAVVTTLEVGNQADYEIQSLSSCHSMSFHFSCDIFKPIRLMICPKKV